MISSYVRNYDIFFIQCYLNLQQQIPGEVANEFWKEQLECKLTVTLVIPLNSILKQFYSFRKRNKNKLEQMFLLGNFNIVKNCFLVTLSMRAFDKLSSRFVLFSLKQRHFHSSVY